MYLCNHRNVVTGSGLIFVTTMVLGFLAMGNYVSNPTGRTSVMAICFTLSGLSVVVGSWKWYLYKRQGPQIKQYEVRTVNGIEQVAV